MVLYELLYGDGKWVKMLKINSLRNIMYIFVHCM